MLTRFISVLVVFLSIYATADQLQAQDNTRAKSGSFYSGIGFGVPADVLSPATMGIGLPGVSSFSGTSPSISNPAHWGLAGYTQGNIILGLDTFSSTDNLTSARSSYIGIESFQFVFPVLRNKLGVSASVTPLVRADYKRRENGFIDPFPGLDQNEVEYIVSTLGSGGINRFEVGFGFKPVSNITLGYAFSANVLSMNKNITPIFSNLQYNPLPYDVNVEGYNFGHRFGLFAFKNSIFRDSDQLSFGASVSLPVTIDAKKSVSAFRTVNGQQKLIILNENDQNREGTVKLPLEFNTGLTYNLNRYSSIVAEAQLQNWNDAGFTFDPSEQKYFKDRVRAGLGFQYHPYRTDQRGGFFSNFKYSVGTSFDNGHLTIQDQNIETLFLHAGVGLMSRQLASSIDLSFQYGIRGTDSSNLVKEHIWGFKLSLNLAEFMFVQQKFR